MFFEKIILFILSIVPLLKAFMVAVRESYFLLAMGIVGVVSLFGEQNMTLRLPMCSVQAHASGSAFPAAPPMLDLWTRD